MDITDAFNQLQSAADADREQVKEARARRDKFRDAFEPEDEVDDVIPSGSLARSTQREPINDVDLVVVFDADKHPDWGQDGASAADALDHLQKRIRTLLGNSEGTFDQVVRLASPRNHAVKCFLDDPEDANAFTVDAMPALRREGHLLVPEKNNTTWIDTDPEYLIAEVARRQGEWDQFRPLVRVLKMWNKASGAGMKSLTVEVLALKHLPEASSRSRALQRFFSAAELAVDQPIEDPANLCGEIEPDLDAERVKEKLADAATNSWKAVDAQDADETDRAACLWRKVFGDAFPEPEDGCPSADADGETGSGLLIGIGATTEGGSIGVDQPRPVRDAPQG
jgi:hypothetical protein